MKSRKKRGNGWQHGDIFKTSYLTGVNSAFLISCTKHGWANSASVVTITNIRGQHSDIHLLESVDARTIWTNVCEDREGKYLAIEVIDRRTDITTWTISCLTLASGAPACDGALPEHWERTGPDGNWPDGPGEGERLLQLHQRDVVLFGARVVTVMRKDRCHAHHLKPPLTNYTIRYLHISHFLFPHLLPLLLLSVYVMFSCHHGPVRCFFEPWDRSELAAALREFVTNVTWSSDFWPLEAVSRRNNPLGADDGAPTGRHGGEAERSLPGPWERDGLLTADDPRLLLLLRLDVANTCDVWWNHTLMLGQSLVGPNLKIQIQFILNVYENRWWQSLWTHHGIQSVSEVQGKQFHPESHRTSRWSASCFHLWTKTLHLGQKFTFVVVVKFITAVFYVMTG